MRIAIAGASGTGKTTLARAISARYNIPINPVGSRSVAIEMGFDKPYDVDKAGKRAEFQRKLIADKRSWELAHDSFVTDRSYFDNLTYCMLHMAEDLEATEIETVTESMWNYDAVFLLHPALLQSLDDGIRKPNRGYQKVYDLILRGLFYQYKNRLRLVSEEKSSGTLVARQEMAFQLLDGWPWR